MIAPTDPVTTIRLLAGIIVLLCIALLVAYAHLKAREETLKEACLKAYYKGRKEGREAERAAMRRYGHPDPVILPEDEEPVPGNPSLRMRGDYT